jgi:outer membrane protein assembly factor BamA
MVKPAENILLSIGVCLVFVLASCSSNRFLAPGETFLEENAVVIRSEERVRNKAVLRSDLEKLYLQKETRVFLGIPRHWFYYQAEKKPGDTTGIRKLLRKMGDDPVITDTLLAQQTEATMIRYLQQHGYWNAQVDHSVRTDAKRSRVTYRVDPNRLWMISSVRYVSQDSTIQSILDTLARESLLPPGAPVDVDLYEQEKLRITRALQNRGYAYFFQNYVAEPIADSSRFEMALEIEITNPSESDRHIRYTIGDVTVYPDANTPDSTRKDSVVSGFHFRISDPPRVRPGVLARNVYLIPGTQYTRDAYDKTLQQLGRLETYRFVTVRPQVSSRDSTVIDYAVSLVRSKKMGVGGDIELNYSSIALRSLLGLSGNVNFRNRNLLRGAELFSTNIEAGIEINLERASASRVYSANVSLQNNLEIPKFIDPFRFYHLLNQIRPWKNGLLGDQTFTRLHEGNTMISAGYQYLSLFNLYDYHSLTARLGFDAQPDRKRRLQLNHMGVDYFSPQTKPLFDTTILEDNVFLRESFRKQLLTGILFRDYRYAVTGTPRLHKLHFAVIHSAELSGLEILAANSLYNVLSGTHEPFELGNKDPVSFSHFARFEIDTRMYYNIASNQQLAFRLAAGVAFPFGPYTTQVPYIKQFYVGGPSSIRAWQVRELGPGDMRTRM